jgi:hypothetical protein
MVVVVSPVVLVVVVVATAGHTGLLRLKHLVKQALDGQQAVRGGAGGVLGLGLGLWWVGGWVGGREGGYIQRGM